MKISKLYIVMLIAFIAIFPASFLITQNFIDTQNHENRTLAEFPEISVANYGNITSGIESAFNDHLPYKNQLKTMNSTMTMALTQDSDMVLKGEDDFLFYKLEQCIDDYQGTVEITAEELNDISAAVSRAQSFFDEKDIKVIFTILPNKEEIMHEYMPSNIKVKNETSRVDKIVNHLNTYNNSIIVYPYQKLVDCPDQTYMKYDTHMNNLGAYISAQAILEAGGFDCMPYDILKKTPQKDTISGDLAKLLNMEDKYGDDHDYDIEGYYIGEEPELIVVDVNKDNNVVHKFDRDGTCLIVGDSFANYICQYIAPDFYATVTMHRDHFTREFYDSVLPKVVVFEWVERSAPGSMAEDLNRIIDMLE